MLIIAIMLVLMGVQAFTTGILSELSTRTYYASRQIRSYVLRSEIVGRSADSTTPSAKAESKDADTA